MLLQPSASEQKLASQIFSTSAASGILANDLVDIMKTEPDTGIAADAIDYNIFSWSVRIHNFPIGR